MQENLYEAYDNEWLSCAETQLEKVLALEFPFSSTKSTRVNSRLWTFMKRHHEVTVYRPASSSNAAREMKKVSMQRRVGVGSIEGTVYDALTGLRWTTSQDIVMCGNYVKPYGISKASVLDTFIDGTNNDELRYLGVQWQIIDDRQKTYIFKRDMCSLVYSGISKDPQGRTYGFQIMIPVNYPTCPKVENACRWNTEIAYIYRQSSENTISVFSCVTAPVETDLPRSVTRMSPSKQGLSVAGGIKCAEALRLTLLAIQKTPALQSQNSVVHPHQTSIESSNVSRSNMTTSNGSNSFVSNLNPPTFSKKDKICDTCKTHESRKSIFMSRKFSWCRVCCVQLCKKCWLKKHMLSNIDTIATIVCKQCYKKSQDLSDIKYVSIDPQRWKQREVESRLLTYGLPRDEQMLREIYAMRDVVDRQAESTYNAHKRSQENDLNNSDYTPGRAVTRSQILYEFERTGIETSAMSADSPRVQFSNTDTHNLNDPYFTEASQSSQSNYDDDLESSYISDALSIEDLSTDGSDKQDVDLHHEVEFDNNLNTNQPHQEISNPKFAKTMPIKKAKDKTVRFMDTVDITTENVYRDSTESRDRSFSGITEQIRNGSPSQISQSSVNNMNPLYQQLLELSNQANVAYKMAQVTKTAMSKSQC